MQESLAIVTGGGRGIGAATVKLLIERGAQVFAMSRTDSDLQSLASQFKASQLQVMAGDVSDPECVIKLFDRAETVFKKRVSILVNNAAVFRGGLLQDLTFEDWEMTQAINQRGTFLCAREFFMRWSTKKQSADTGVIVNVSSLGGVRGTQKFAGMSAYVASKAAVIGMTEAWAVEGRPLGIRVNAVAPGAVDTQMLREAAPFLKTQTQPEDIAQVIAYLADPKNARAVTGAVVEVHSNG